ncbi:hypothetical protein KQH61_03865 [bacterium]|nr:hypothetical protein [bacterium]MCB2179039.1 hypothetical protein [bacterium]
MKYTIEKKEGEKIEGERRTRLLAYLKTLLDEKREALRQWCRAELAGTEDSPEGFAHFYALIYRRELPRHAREEWLPLIYAAGGQGKGTLIEAFRGSGKSSTLSVAWVAFRIGHHPAESNIIIQAGNDSARDTCNQVMDLIANHESWEAVFRWVRPDFKKWGGKGYEVKRTDMPYKAWRALAAQTKGKDPTLLGVGYTSWAVIGKHPTGVLLIDDIHDENNTCSGRALEKVRHVVTGTILPTVTVSTWQVVVGTPWVGEDILAYLKATGRYLHVRTPVLRDEKPVWPERFPADEIERRRQESGVVEFARMYLLDLGAASGAHLRREWLGRYPMARIDPGWPVVMGVDYASAADRNSTRDRDYFAVAIGRALPGGAGVVLVDGFRGRVSQGEAEMRLKQMAEMYPTTQLIGVEAVGKGEEFYHLMLRTSRLPIQQVQPGRSSKGERFEKGMAPLFQFNRAWISDVETPFLRAFEQEWVSWPQGAHDDTLDAVYWMLYVGAPHLLPRQTRTQSRNPFVALGRG